MVFESKEESKEREEREEREEEREEEEREEEERRVWRGWGQSTLLKYYSNPLVVLISKGLTTHTCNI